MPVSVGRPFTTRAPAKQLRLENNLDISTSLEIESIYNALPHQFRDCCLSRLVQIGNESHSLYCFEKIDCHPVQFFTINFRFPNFIIVEVNLIVRHAEGKIGHCEFTLQQGIQSFLSSPRIEITCAPLPVDYELRIVGSAVVGR